jgi:broad specificity phosphatase PhoE
MQSVALARRVAGRPVAAIQSSPLLRARQTAEAVAEASNDNAAVDVVDALNEIDFGRWTGRDFSTLETDAEWRRWNAERDVARPPDGEAMADAQGRAVAHVRDAAAAYAGETILMVSHCDIIRAVVAHYLGLPLTAMLRFDVDPASRSTLRVGDWGGQLLCLNEPCQ